ncbi:UNVERIFIED_CONTAM: hypothetical protein Slati_3078300 [Sesamum latifolium]|uniref:Reverse transcriptase zinc-binding domain-containing protein n=1 Tax=Sesamum latifolium TaxID=2727402 RepID=A0AAW2UUX9_9LAMI
MSRHLWRIISVVRTSLWVDWIFHYRLRTHSVWTVSDLTGKWGWRKLIRLRGILQQFIEYKIGSGASFSLWHDLWHELGPLILRFSMEPRHTNTRPSTFLNTVIMEGSWCWQSISNMESVEITHSLPIIYGGQDRIVWTAPGGTFSPASAYAIFHPPGPTVGWSSLLLGTFKIPRHRFILWLAILERRTGPENALGGSVKAINAVNKTI